MSSSVLHWALGGNVAEGRFLNLLKVPHMPLGLGLLESWTPAFATGFPLLPQGEPWPPSIVYPLPQHTQTGRNAWAQVKKTAPHLCVGNIFTLEKRTQQASVINT